MGTIKTILILHGWAYDTEKWDSVVSRLKQSSHRVEVLKIPGLTEKIDRPWTIDDYVSWLDAIVTKTKGEIVLLGHSNGGRIVISYALKHPQKVTDLVLIDSAGIYHKELPIRIKRLIFKAVANVGKKITTSKLIRKLLYKLVGESDYLESTGPTRQTMQSLIKTDLEGSLPGIKTPTLIIWGENDITTPLSDGELMHEKIINSKFEIIKGARHSPQFTNTERVCDLIIKFI